MVMNKLYNETDFEINHGPGKINLYNENDEQL